MHNKDLKAKHTPSGGEAVGEQKDEQPFWWCSGSLAQEGGVIRARQSSCVLSQLLSPTSQEVQDERWRSSRSAALPFIEAMGTLGGGDGLGGRGGE